MQVPRSATGNRKRSHVVLTVTQEGGDRAKTEAGAAGVRKRGLIKTLPGILSTGLNRNTEPVRLGAQVWAGAGEHG